MFIKCKLRSVPKFTSGERTIVKSLVAELSVKRIPDSLIISEVFKKTGKSITRMGLFKIKQSIKTESAKWYKTMRQSQFEYIHEFKERINEIMDLQRQALRDYRFKPKEPFYSTSIIGSSP
jgi:hypothetical protein